MYMNKAAEGAQRGLVLALAYSLGRVCNNCVTQMSSVPLRFLAAACSIYACDGNGLGYNNNNNNNNKMNWCTGAWVKVTLQLFFSIPHSICSPIFLHH